MPAPFDLHTNVASDPDMIGPNSQVTYTFQPPPQHPGLFTMQIVGDPPNDIVIKVRHEQGIFQNLKQVHISDHKE